MMVHKSNRRPPKNREPKKETKKSFQENIEVMFKKNQELARQKIQEKERKKHEAVEDEMMSLIYGPDWKNRP
jgi:hypothetical protein